MIAQGSTQSPIICKSSSGSSFANANDSGAVRSSTNGNTASALARKHRSDASQAGILQLKSRPALANVPSHLWIDGVLDRQSTGKRKPQSGQFPSQPESGNSTKRSCVREERPSSLFTSNPGRFPEFCSSRDAHGEHFFLKEGEDLQIFLCKGRRPAHPAGTTTEQSGHSEDKRLASCVVSPHTPSDPLHLQSDEDDGDDNDDGEPFTNHRQDLSAAGAELLGLPRHRPLPLKIPVSGRW
jgi:hypothetical protein